METAAEKTPWLGPMLKDWVKGLRQSKTCPGGFARHVKDSPKFKRKFKQRILDDTSSAMTALLSAAGQERSDSNRPSASGNTGFSDIRFDALTDPLQMIFRNIETVLGTLAEEESSIGGDREWARGILDRQMAYEPLVSLSLATEVFQLGKAWTHARDQRKRGVFGSIAVVKRLNDSFRKDLTELFLADPPLAFANGYTTGLTRHLFDILERSIKIRSGGASSLRVVAWPRTWKDRMKPLANVRLFVRYVLEFMDATFPHARFQEALSPFDLVNWAHRNADTAHEPRSEQDILRRYFDPLAKARGIDVDAAVSGFFRVRSLADEMRRRGDDNIVSYWSQALRQRRAEKNYEEFARLALPALCQFLGNGELEGDFSILKRVGVKARALQPALISAVAKVRLDGPEPFVLKNGSEKGRDWCERVRTEYIRLFGAKSFAAAEAKRKETVVVDSRVGVKRPNLWKGAQEAGRKRRKQMETLRALPPRAPEKDCLFGAAPSAAEKAAFSQWNTDVTDSPAVRATVESLRKKGAELEKKYAKDALPISQDPALRKRLEKEREIEKEFAESRLAVTVSNPERDLHNKKRLFIYNPATPHRRILVYAPDVSKKDRVLLEKLHLTLTTRREIAFPKDAGQKPMHIALLSNAEDFLRGRLPNTIVVFIASLLVSLCRPPPTSHS